jgi:hypothetical protein
MAREGYPDATRSETVKQDLLRTRIANPIARQPEANSDTMIQSLSTHTLLPNRRLIQFKICVSPAIRRSKI